MSTMDKLRRKVSNGPTAAELLEATKKFYVKTEALKERKIGETVVTIRALYGRPEFKPIIFRNLKQKFSKCLKISKGPPAILCFHIILL